MLEAQAVGNLVHASVQLGSDLAVSGHAVSLAADERTSFTAKLKGDFEALSLAIANLPVGFIPFPDKAKAALQKLNTDVVHGVTTGTLDVAAISADKDAVAAALGVSMGPGGGTASSFEKLQ
ncbi:hypothetical protein WJX75_004853 [Coccomyxa subellipsoidea]|uniref:Uncharacterized protein n=1 Tax=Coccomyxa subellipsoidea TaxID=248742 RepID=A0ABR2YF32_9CHLO